MAEKYTQMQVKNRREVTRLVNGNEVTFIRFKGVLRYAVPNPDYVEKPEGDDTRLARQKRRTVWKEITRMLEAEKVTKGRKSQEKKDAETERNIQAALQEWRDSMEAKANSTEASEDSVYQIVSDYIDRRERLSEAKEAQHQGDETREGEAINKERPLAKSTIRDYRHTLSFIKPYFSKITPSQLGTKEMIKWEEEQVIGGTSYSRIRKAHILINSALNSAIVHGIIEANRISVMTPPSAGSSRKDKGLTQKDMKDATRSLSNALKAEPVMVGAMIALHCGLRAGEVCALKWSDVSFEYRMITVQRAIGIGDGGCFVKPPKSESGYRTLYMDDRTLEMLKRRRALMLKQRQDITTDFEDLYIVGDVDGNFLSPTTLSRKWTTLSSSWGLEDLRGGTCTFHGLRHSYVTALKNTSSTDVDEIKLMSKLAGHSSAQMTAKYGSRDWQADYRKGIAVSEYMEPDNDKPAEVYELKTGTND